jgi:hypothetical protein
MTGSGESPDVELIAPGRVRVKCAKCHELIVLEFGDLTRIEAECALHMIDVPRECPGFHVELSGWDRLWHFKEALELVYGPASKELTTGVLAGAGNEGFCGSFGRTHSAGRMTRPALDCHDDCCAEPY